MKQHRSSIFPSLKILTTAAMLTAVSVVIGAFCKNFLNFGNGLFRITFENLPVILSGILFGPIIGGIVGISTDLVSYLLSPQIYPPNLIVTFGAFSVGFISGIMSHFVIRKRGTAQIILSAFSAHIVGSMIIKPIGLYQFYGWAVLWRIPLYLMIVPIEIILLCLLFRNRSFQAMIGSSGVGIQITDEKTQESDTAEEKPMDYQESLRYIHSVSGHFCKPGLERITTLCDALGHPEKDLRFIHVAGTNGKGSFCAMTESILRTAGYKTGLYTSPFIKEFNERMRVNGENISREELVELTEQVRPIADSMEDKPTEFELITAIAFLYFKRHHCDVVVLEVGLGGRLDSTNVIQAPILSVITGIDFDHTDLLGDTLEAIAAEKGGIIKSGCPVLYGGSDASVYQTLKNISDAQGARLYTVDPTRLSVRSMTVDGTVMDFGEWKELKLPLLGTYQPQNAVSVLSAIELLNATGKWNIPESAVRTGLATVKWHARFEKLKDSPLVFFDGSHNPQGIATAVNTIRTYFPDQKVDILTGVMRDKNFEVMIDCISQVADCVFTVTPANPRALPAEEYAAHFRSHGVDASAYPTVNEGVKAAVSHARNANVPLICLGSLYLYGELADLIQEEP